MIDNLIALNIFSKRMVTSLSVDEILLLWYVDTSINFRGYPFNVPKSLYCLNQCPY